MRPSVELAVLRWAVVALFVLQISQFAKTTYPAAAAQKPPTIESLNERLTVLERKHDNLNSTYLAHQHLLANLASGVMPSLDCSRSIASAAATPAFLGSI